MIAFRRAVPVLVLVLALAGCGDARRDAIGRVAADFGSAVAAGDGGSACDLLGPATAQRLADDAGVGCTEAIVQAELPDAGAVRRVDVYGGQARVVLDADTLFLAEFSAGWKVVAAGCAARDGKPYDCRVEGG